MVGGLLNARRWCVISLGFTNVAFATREHPTCNDAARSVGKAHANDIQRKQQSKPGNHFNTLTITLVRHPLVHLERVHCDRATAKGAET